MYQVIYDLAKTKIETGELPDVETYVKTYKKSIKISLPQLELLRKAETEVEQSNQEEKGDESR